MCIRDRLKDAASGAIYGTRAANGVILVTTKGGEKGKMRVNYNFSYGWQNPWKPVSYTHLLTVSLSGESTSIPLMV